MIKAGIIGFGYMGEFHLKKMQLFSDISVNRVFDISEKKLENASLLGLQTCSSLEDFLAADLDLVVIATPNQWHCPYAIAAMKAGKNVLLEKPATLSVNELEQIIKCSRETGKFFTVHQQRRWDPDYQAVCKTIKEKLIGNVTTIESRVLGERGICFGWRADPEAGGGMLYDWGVHLIDQMLQLFNPYKVIQIYARLSSILTPAVDDYFELELSFEHDICARIVVSTFALQKLPRWYVFGDRGTLKLDDFTGIQGGISRIRENVKGFDSMVGKHFIGPSRTMAPLQREYLETLPLPTVNDDTLMFWTNLKNACEGKAQLNVTPDHILRQMKIVEAAFQSSKSKEVIHCNI